MQKLKMCNEVKIINLSYILRKKNKKQTSCHLIAIQFNDGVFNINLLI